jgi:hypothetical protein
MSKRSGIDRCGTVVGVAVAVLLIATSGIFGPVCTDRAFIDIATGSRRGHREWPLGLVSSSWTRPSPVEERLRAIRPGAIEHQWVSYAGTGRALFGVVSRGHGRPGSIVSVHDSVLVAWASKEPDEVLRIHAVLGSGDEVAIQALIEATYRDLLGP